MTKEEKKEYMRKWRQDNAEKIKEYMKQYHKQYNKNNSERRKEYNKQYRKDNAERLKEQRKQYRQTPMGRASKLLTNYNQADRKANRGQGDLTAEWIIENIFTKPCAHCGKEGWKVIGCNRLDNSLPHTKDNVEPCCFECNCKLSGRPLKIQNDN